MTATLDPTTAVPAPAQRLKIKPKIGWQPLDFAELVHYRELLWILALRDIKVRYKQTKLGFGWAILQPLATTIAFSILGSLGGLETDHIPRPLFVLCGLLPWLLFSNAINAAGNSLVGNQHLITKVYFPRLVMPLSAIITSLVDFAISFGLLLILMAWYHRVPGIQILLLPVFVIMSFTAALAAGLWLSALNVEFRDVRYVLPLGLNMMQFATPLLYSSTTIKTPWKHTLLSLNPLTGVVEGFRWCMVGGTPPGPMLWVSVAGIVALLVGGLYYFRRMEKTFADLV